MAAGQDLSAHVALVTGASRGIGAAVALTLAELGAAVAVNYRERADDAEAVVARIKAGGGRAIAVAADVSQAAAVAAMVEQVASALGPIDILVNNAGVAIVRGVDDLTEDDFDRTIAVNLKSAFLCTQAVLPMMRARQWGRIVNISSGAARGAGAIGVHYNASKAGMEGLTRGYAARLVKEGITVNAVAPSLIATDMMGGRTDLAAQHPARPHGPGRGGGASRRDGARQRLHDRTDHRPQWRHGVHLTRAVLLSVSREWRAAICRAAASTRSARSRQEAVPLRSTGPLTRWMPSFALTATTSSPAPLRRGHGTRACSTARRRRRWWCGRRSGFRRRSRCGSRA